MNEDTARELHGLIDQTVKADQAGQERAIEELYVAVSRVWVQHVARTTSMHHPGHTSPSDSPLEDLREGQPKGTQG